MWLEEGCGVGVRAVQHPDEGRRMWGAVVDRGAVQVTVCVWGGGRAALGATHAVCCSPDAEG